VKHFFQKAQEMNKPIFLLLHGTGGSEFDLLPVAEMIDKSAAVLGVRGNVMENGMPRFFKRIAEGVFDEKDLIFQTKELYEFLARVSDEYEFNRNRLIAVGYSNGANIASSLLYHYKDALKGAILFHPMVPRRGLELPDLSGTSVFIGAGLNDPICSPEETEELAHTLESAGAKVEVHWENNGHSLTREEIEKAVSWYTKLSNKGRE
jgi:phospholipase/carboxylesterase